ncbi:DsrE family protein [Hwanghaeella sp.]|uniref:DsrE family protein n=1 Tax=Hwanghaeella sp. TaxID=2605943 RepID=UPI003CCBA1D3
MKLFSVRKMAVSLAVTALVLGGFWMKTSPVSAAESKVHKIAVQVNDNDPKTMNIALNNIANTQAYYAEKGEAVEIELVAYGPGLHMLRADSSPVKDRIAAMALESEHLKFSACANTIAGMTKKEGIAPEIISEASVVPSGVVRLVELQETGYAYVKP